MTMVQRSVTEQFEVVRQSLEQLVNNCKSLSDYVRKLLSLERDFARGLQKLTKNAADTGTGKAVQFLGSAGAGWLYTLQLTQQVSEHRLQVGDTVEERALRPLGRVFDGDLDKRRKQLIAEGRRYLKEMEQADQKLQRAKSNYTSAAREWESVLLGLHREHGDIWAPSASRLREKEATSCTKCQQMKIAYLSEVSSINIVQHAYYFDKMPQLLSRLTQLAHDLVSVACTALQSLQQHATKTLDAELAKSFVSTSGWSPLESLDVKQYCHDFILCHFNTDDAIPPQPYVFKEYLMADEAASIHAKKVQYEIIKCFPSASELGMRAKVNPPVRNPTPRSSTFYTEVDESESSVSDPEPADVRDSVESPEQLLESVDEAIGRANSNSVSAMLSLRQAILRGGQVLKSKFTREGVVLGEDISQPVLQPWPYNLDMMADRLHSYPKCDSPSAASTGSPEPLAAASSSQISTKPETSDSAPFAVQCCVGYLEKPVSLREEGLFRVPGDVTRIQQLHAAFVADEDAGSSNARLRSFLMREINAELNPNTIAGLLKMYLRQKGVFSGEESRHMSDICRLVKGDVFRACQQMRDALKRIAKRSYAVLQSVIGLLKKVVDHGDENRMSVQAVALSCGLSVFPEMFDTGDAVNTLKFFLNNYDSVFQVGTK